MIPLFQKTRALPPGPLPGTHYLLATNGLFLVQDTPLFHATTGLAPRRDLQPVTASLRLRIPPVPRQLLEEAYGFFLEVFRRYESEAFASILYEPDSATFSLAVPTQRLTYADGWGGRMALGVHYDAMPRPPGLILLGDIHSHGSHRAFFSSTDDHDDLAREGLHLVLGCLHQTEPDVCVSVVTNRTRFNLTPSDVLEPFSAPIAPPETWLAQVTVEPVVTLPELWISPSSQAGGPQP